VLAAESAVSENMIAASGDWVTTSEMGDTDPALVGASFVVL
jgi:hypothetical protein